jgi:Na+-translocating ferredoxin:NAD+ oxidoreductase subunit G
VRALVVVIGLFAASLVVTPAQAAARGATLSTPELLRSFFPTSETVSFVEITRGELHAACGDRPVSAPRDKYIVYVATTGGQVDGYAVIDDEKGQHEPITFGVRLDPSARVTRVEVMAYREAYGDEIRDRRFLRQLEGKGADSRLQLGTDVDGISGATISSRSSTVAVRRAAALAAAARKKTAP